MSEWVVEMLASFAGSLGFGVIFNVRGRKIWLCAAGGLVCWGLFLGLEALTRRAVLSYGLASLLISIWALALARRIKTPTISLFVPAIIPLIPGGSLYYTALGALSGDWDACFQQGINALSIAVAIAAGMAVISSLDVVYQTFKRRRAR